MVRARGSARRTRRGTRGRSLRPLDPGRCAAITAVHRLAKVAMAATRWISHSVSLRAIVFPGAAAATRRACSASAISRRMSAVLARPPSGSSTRPGRQRAAPARRETRRTPGRVAPRERYSGCVIDWTKRSRSSAAGFQVSARTNPARLPKWCRINGVGDAGFGRDVLQPQALRAGAGNERPGRLDDQALRLLQCAANPSGPVRSSRERSFL